MFMSLTSKLKTAAHPFLGSLPEQEWFDEHIHWYNCEVGCFYRFGLEYVLGFASVIVYPLKNPDLYGTLFAAGAGTVIGIDLMRMEGHPEVHAEGESFGPTGTILLEIPWRIGKGMVRLGQRAYDRLYKREERSGDLPSGFNFS